MGSVVPNGLVDGEPWLGHRGLPLGFSETSETTETGSAGVFVVSVVSVDGCKGLATNRGEAGRPRPWGSREGSGSTRRREPCCSQSRRAGARSVGFGQRARAGRRG